MRLRGRAFKYLTLSVMIIIILIVGLNNLTQRGEQDEFLIHLPEEQPSDNKQSLTTYGHLLNLTNFQYTIPNNLCNNYVKELLAVIIVTSYVGHDELRAAHRQAIAQSKLIEMGFQRVFLLAEIPSTENFIKQEQVLNEQERFGDILQGNFKEAYRNLSYKHVMGLRWAAMDCSNAKFIVKLDDDIIYDIFQLKRYLENLEVKETKLASSESLLAGYILSSQLPVRNVANKWFVSKKEFAGNIYPSYLSGWMYITNARTALRLVSSAHQIPIFWIDDTWLTGIVREQLHIPMQNLTAWFSANAEFLDCCVRDLKQSNYECEYFVGPNGGDSKLLVEFLHNVEKCYFDECSKREPEKSLKQTCVAAAKHMLPAHGNAFVKPLNRIF